MLVLDIALLEHRPVKHRLMTDHERTCAKLQKSSRRDWLRLAIRIPGYRSGESVRGRGRWMKHMPMGAGDPGAAG